MTERKGNARFCEKKKAKAGWEKAKAGREKGKCWWKTKRKRLRVEEHENRGMWCVQSGHESIMHGPAGGNVGMMRERDG